MWKLKRMCTWGIYGWGLQGPFLHFIMTLIITSWHRFLFVNRFTIFLICHILEQYVTSIYWWSERVWMAFEKGLNPFSQPVSLFLDVIIIVFISSLLCLDRFGDQNMCACIVLKKVQSSTPLHLIYFSATLPRWGQDSTLSLSHSPIVLLGTLNIWISVALKLMRHVN
jgi:hypothetical protein